MTPWWWPLGAVPEVASAELHRLLEQGGASAPQLLDVRTALEFALGHVRGARSVPIVDLKGRLGGLALDRARPVVAICLTAHRSIPAVRLLREAGYQASQLTGGMLAWRAAGLPETRG